MMRRTKDEEEDDYARSIRVANEAASASSGGAPGGLSAGSRRQQVASNPLFLSDREAEERGSGSASPSATATATAASAKDNAKEESGTTQKLPFPWKLHTLLDDAEKEGYQDIISWEDDGKAFCVHKPDQFCESILGKYFRQSKYESFTRQRE